MSLQVQEAQRVQIKMNSKRPTPRHIIIKMPSFIDKERILKGARENKREHIRELRKASSLFPNRNTISQKGMARNIPSNEKQKPETKITLSNRELN